jgi:sphingolipid delta-4 desaturase
MVESDFKRGEDGFYWSKMQEPHAVRKMDILSKYPEMKKLMGPHPANIIGPIVTVALQLTMAYLVRDLDWKWWFLATYVVSGTANHSLTLAMHELSHNLAFKKPNANKLFSLFANLPLGLPSAITFRKYHLEHHRYQGEDGVDVDIPTELEAKIFRGMFMKLLYVILQPLFYSLRPLFINPKPISMWEVANMITAISFDLLIYKTLGLKSLLYFLCGSLLGLGLHPCAGHFISEHYVYFFKHKPVRENVDGLSKKDQQTLSEHLLCKDVPQETHSYYGPLNFVSYNVGCHNEHHDFPNIPSARLNKVREIAPEYYYNLYYYTSWTWVLVDFILRGEISPSNRVKRVTLSKDERKELNKKGLKTA